MHNSGMNSGKPTGRPPDPRRDWAAEFIGALMEGLTIRAAAQCADVDISMPYHRKRTDPEFAEAWKEAVEIGTEFLEYEAARRGFHGVVEPVFYKGVECGHVRKYSDTLLMFLLKGRKPEKYREYADESIRGQVVVNVNIVSTDKIESKPVDVVPEIKVLQANQTDPSATSVTSTTPTHNANNS